MASNQAPAEPYWVAQLNSPPAAKSKVAGIVDPPGFSGAPSAPKERMSRPSRGSPLRRRERHAQAQKAWEVALAPVKGLPMTAIMMYMSGNSLQIFSIMMVFMAFKNPIVGLMSTNQAFERFQTDSNSGQILQTKLVYVAMQFLALAVGIWKINSMGLLPTTRSDWMMWENLREPVEHAILAL
ncbi:hypothetical protein TrVFT333_001572 [Trichoderma virens FT-333]|nr:hypothetical protein TrVFT333_001572 [Trichoderma virens FT-333]